MTDRKRTETKIGLYTVVRESEPLELPALKPGESYVQRDEPLPRVRQWLDDIFKAIHAIRTEPDKYPESVRQSAQRCSVWATQLKIHMREMDESSTHTAAYVAQAIEIAAELADEWHMLKVNMCLEKPVNAYDASARTGRGNLTKGDSKEKSDAEAQAVFDKWCQDPSRQSQLVGLSPADRLRKYLKIEKRTTKNDRLRRRLRDMSKAGKLN